MSTARASGIVALPCDLGVERIGGKAHGLAQLMRLGADVPRAFVITADADVDAPEFPAELERALAALGDVPLAVRSSGVAEDGAAASFAGVHDTVLDVRGAAAVAAAVARCRASARGERAVAYRARHAGGGGAGLAVVVQELVRADVAGVAFSADPVTRRRERCVIEAVRGLGERLVSGEATPERAVVVGGVVERAQGAPEERCLDDALALEVSRLALDLERRLGFPVDIEWAVAGGGGGAGRVQLLQVRPITTRLDEPVPAQTGGERQRVVVYSNTNAAEVLPDVLTPMALEVIERYVDALLRPALEPFGGDLKSLGVFGVVGGRVYFCMNAVVGWLRTFPGVSRLDMAAFTKMLGGDHEGLRAALALLRPEDLPLLQRLPLWRLLYGACKSALPALQHHDGNADALVARLRERNAALGAVDVAALDAPALAAHIEQLLESPFGENHSAFFGASGVGMIAQLLLPKVTRRWLGDVDGAVAHRLMQGMGGLHSAESGLALAELGALARREDVVDALTSRAALEQRGERGRRFLAAFDAFLVEHGHRARGECDVGQPRWAEEPDYVLRLVRATAHLDASTSPASAAPERQRARRALLDELAAKLGPVRRRILRALVARCAAGAAARENGKSQAMRRVLFVRLALLECGRRLRACGAVDDAGDVFFLEYAELAPALLTQRAPRELIARRRAEHARLVSLPAPPPIVIEGAAVPPAAPVIEDGSALVGTAASPGVVEGVARVVLHSDDDTVVNAGEILVAPFTDPGWAPYFLPAAAVVTDFGGVLSHGAVIAREYGLPAVVNCGRATRAIKSGDRVRVDGDRGTVTILPA